MSGGRGPSPKILKKSTNPLSVKQPVCSRFFRPEGLKIGVFAVEQKSKVGSEFFDSLISESLPETLVNFVASARLLRSPARMHKLQILMEL